MKKILTNLLMFALLPWLAMAQVSDEEILLDQLTIGAGDIALINQYGDHNDLFLVQNAAQTAQVRQEGMANEASLLAQGYGIRLRVDQKGDGNHYQLDLQGDHNAIYLRQDGDDNTVLQELTGVENMVLLLSQKGDHNRIEHQESGMNGYGLPFKIEQKGNGLNLIIKSRQNF